MSVGTINLPGTIIIPIAPVIALIRYNIPAIRAIFF
jgi:hypothetical protein